MGATANSLYAWTLAAYKKATEDNGVSFLDQIEADIIAAQESVASGVIQTVSGNGLSTTFAVNSSLSPEIVLETCVVLRKLYFDAKTDLASRATPVTDPSDEQLREAMLQFCVPQRRMMGDFFTLRQQW